MRTLIIGGGKGCRSILDLTRGPFLKEIKLDIVAVVDHNAYAPGMLYAHRIGLQTFTDMCEAISEVKDIEVIIELTGKDETLKELYSIIKPGIKIIDHNIARIFWDLVNAREEQYKRFHELKDLEKELELERLALRSIFDNLADLAAVIDLGMEIINVNAKFSEFAGIAAQDAIGKICCDVLKGTELAVNKENDVELVKKVFLTSEAQSTILITPAPNENHWEITYSPIISEDGTITSVLITWHRITEKVMLHREIESAEQKFISFINSAQDWISIKDLEGRYIIVNPVTARAFHLPSEYFLGKRPQDIFDSKMAKTINMHDSLVINSMKAHTFDEIIPIDGAEHHFHTVRFPLTDYKGELIGVCTIARDVTKEYHLQEQLIQSEKLAGIGKLAAGVAHEINNPLTGILAYAEDLIENVNEEACKNDLSIIIKETLRCRDIVRNLLDFARQDKPKLEAINPNKIVEQSLNLIQKLPQFKDIKIIQELSDNLPLIQLDEKQIQQVLLNLMLNATEAMQSKGTITIKTKYEKKKQCCSISVSDTGPGIPDNLIDKIFEPFFSTKGTNGLGLAVSWGIIERHGGCIEVDASEDGGAVFKVILPVNRD